MQGYENLLQNGDYVTLLASTTITAAVTGVTTTPLTKYDGAHYIIFESIFTYGSGGTTAKFWLQTSLDGSTWIDIANHAFTTASAKKVSAVSIYTALTAGTTPGDAALADNTIVDGLFGKSFRLKYTTTGTYAGGTTIEIYGGFRG